MASDPKPTAPKTAPKRRRPAATAGSLAVDSGGRPLTDEGGRPVAVAGRRDTGKA